MIVLSEVASTLQTLLNGITGLSQYQFVVTTEGHHLDKVYDATSLKNFIPVYVSSMGGQYNPVPDLKQATYTIPVTLYFPVRFKNDFFLLNDYLVSLFVGVSRSYGTLSGNAISNISVAQYGELQQLDLKEFKNWVNQTYQTPIEVMEMWMSMTFTLYLSTAASGYIWGNDATASLSFVLDSTTYSDTNLTFNQSSIQSQSQPTNQQVQGTTEVEGVPFGTSYGSGFTVYMKNTTFYQKIVEKWFEGNIQSLRVTFTMSIKFSNSVTKTYTRNCYVESMNLSVQKGQLATITFAFAKAIEFEDEDEDE